MVISAIEFPTADSPQVAPNLEAEATRAVEQLIMTAPMEIIEGTATVASVSNRAHLQVNAEDHTYYIISTHFGTDEDGEQMLSTLANHGFKVVVSSHFAENFKANAQRKNLLPVQVTEQFLAQIAAHCDTQLQQQLMIDLEEQSIRLVGTTAWEYFSINPAYKAQLMQGPASHTDEFDFFAATTDYQLMLG